MWIKYSETEMINTDNIVEIEIVGIDADSELLAVISHENSDEDFHLVAGTRSRCSAALKDICYHLKMGSPFLDLCEGYKPDSVFGPVRRV